MVIVLVQPSDYLIYAIIRHSQSENLTQSNIIRWAGHLLGAPSDYQIYAIIRHSQSENLTQLIIIRWAGHLLGAGLDCSQNLHCPLINSLV